RRGRVLLARAVGTRGTSCSRGRGGDRRRRHAERLLERLDALRQLEHRDALELVDPLSSCGHASSLASSASPPEASLSVSSVCSAAGSSATSAGASAASASGSVL